MKKFCITLLSVLMLVFGVFSIVACKSDNALAKYVLKENGTLVYEDFELPNKIGEKSVTWTSDKAAIAVEARKGENYLAKVTLGDEAVSTKLTVKQGKQTKDFTVTVGALDVSYFVEKFVFENENATVFADFELPTSFTLFEKTATIKWSVERDADKALISIVEEGGKTMCKVNQSSLNPEVRLYAEFEYNGEKQKTNFRLTVSFERTHIEEVDYWYYNTGVSIKMSGYVLAIGTAYSESYENVTLYMVDDDFCAGYYLYRVKASKADGALLKPGVHVTVTGTTNTNYNGLVETNAGGMLVVDKDVPEVNVAEKIYALDNDLLAKSREALYHTSSMVSLTNWKVTSKAKSAPEEGATATLFTLEKGGVKVAVGVSKYMEGVYATKNTDETYSALVALYNSINVNDVVSVTGILGNYKGFQIIPMKASDVVKAEAGTEESAVPEACTKVAEAITKVQEVFKENGISSTSEDSNVCFKPDTGFVIVANQEIELPTVEGVEIKYELIHGSGTVKSENGKLIVTVGAEDMASLQVTYTVKDGEGKVLYSTRTFHIVHSMDMNDQDIVEKLRFDFVLETTSTVVDEVKLTTKVKEYPSASISWALKEPVEGVDIVDNTIVVTADTTKERKVVLVATFTSGEKSVTKEYDFTVEQAIPFKAGTYKLAIQQNGIADKPKLYFTGTMDGYYGKTSTDYIDAIDVVVAEVANGFTLKAGDNYIELRVSGTHINFTLTPESTGAWEYNYSLKTFTWTETESGTKYYMGTSGTYKTVSLNAISKVTGANASKIGVSEFVAFFEEPKQLTDAEIAAMQDAQNAQKALDAIGKIADITEAGSITLPASTVEGVTLTWALANDNTATSATLTGSTLAVATMPEATETVKLVATATCGDATKTKTITVTIKVVSQAATFEEGIYKLALEQNGLTPAKKLYFKGTLNSSNFGETVEAPATAADIEVKAVTGGYTFKVGDKYLELEAYTNSKGNPAAKLVLVAAATSAWQYDDTLKVFTWTNSDNTYYLGTYGTYETISASATSYISTSYPAKFEKYTVTGMTDAEKVATAVEALNTASWNSYVAATGEIDLPAVNVDGVTVTWTSSNTEYVTIAGNKANVLKLATTEAVEVTISALVACNDESDNTVSLSLTIAVPVNYGTLAAPLSVTEARAIAETQCPADNNITTEIVYMTGKLTNMPIDKNTYYQSLTLADPADPSKTIYVYTINLRDGVDAPIPNDVLVISGYINRYNGDLQFSTKNSRNVYIESKTVGTSTIELTVAEGQATVANLPESATNGTEVSFTVSVNSGFELVSVKVNNKAITANEEGGYKFTVAGNMAVVVETKVQGSADPVVTYTKVTSANASELKVGAKIILTYGDAYAMGAQNGKYRNRVEFNATNPSNDVVIVTLEAVEGKEDVFYLKVSDGYLTAPSSGNNLTTETSATTYSEWSITVAENGDATISNAQSNRVLQYNANNNQERFSTYTGTQKSPVIYVQTTSTPTGGDTTEE